MIKELEDRYLVLKYSDIDAYLDDIARDALVYISNCINYNRNLEGKDVWKGICIKEGTPEYAGVKEALLKRINSKEAA